MAKVIVTNGGRPKTSSGGLERIGTRARVSVMLVVFGVVVAHGAPVAAAPTKQRPPKITPPASVTAEATGPSGAVVRYRPAKAPGAKSIVYSKKSGTLFPLGTTVVKVTARNGAGVSRAKFSVRVVDPTAPSIAAVADVTAEATGPSGAAVDYTPPAARDVVDGEVAVTCAPPPRAQFGLGTSSVSCSASDRAGNIGTSKFNVVVRDTTPPAIAPKADVAAPATGLDGAAVAYGAPTASDSVSGQVVVSCAPPSGSKFPVGATTVTCSARDAAGNTATTVFHVIVRALPASPGTYSGYTSQGHPISFSVSSDGGRIVSFSTVLESPCVPGGKLTFGFIGSYIANINGDGTFSSTGTSSLTGGVTGTATTTLAGQFTSPNTAAGTIRAISTLTAPGPYSCDSDRVPWTATRSAL